MNLLDLPVVLVARGCLAPYFLGWWKNQPSPLHICDFSRWRWFEFGSAADPRWIGPAPTAGSQVVLFDRNTTTGQTLRLLKKWLKSFGYQVVVVGHMDLKMGRYALRYLDYIWDDGEGYNRLGLADDGQKGVQLVPLADYRKEVRGAYTFCVIGGRRQELGDFSQFGGFQCPDEVDIKAEPVPVSGSVVYQNVPSWEEAMLLGYINKKPLITIAAKEGIVADYSSADGLDEVLEFLQQEKEEKG